jgi:hypothetical protein
MEVVMKLGVFVRQSYWVPLALLAFGFIAATSTSHIDAISHISGIGIGGGVVGLLYRMKFKFSAFNGDKADE